MQITDAAVFYARLTRWDQHFDALPVHTVAVQLYYSLLFNRLQPPDEAGHFVVDISDTLDVKMRAIQCYQTQFPPEKAASLDRIRAFALMQGSAAGFTAGELLASPRVLAVRDLMQFLFAQQASSVEQPR